MGTVELRFLKHACLRLDTIASAQRKSCPIFRGLVDFAIGLVILVLNLPEGKVLFFGEIQITEGL